MCPRPVEDKGREESLLYNRFCVDEMTWGSGVASMDYSLKESAECVSEERPS